LNLFHHKKKREEREGGREGGREEGKRKACHASRNLVLRGSLQRLCAILKSKGPTFLGLLSKILSISDFSSAGQKIYILNYSGYFSFTSSSKITPHYIFHNLVIQNINRLDL
jgi:hypothetical protein